MLLTRFPAGRLSEPVPQLKDAAWAYPLAGLAVGLAGAVALLVADLLDLPPTVIALLAIGVMALASGAMHEDGLADTADGFGGGRDKARKLEIMRDSRIGSYGVVALVIATGLRASAISAMEGAWQAAFALVAAAAASRAILPAVMAILPPARTEGLGHSAGAPSEDRVAASIVIGLVALFLLVPLVKALFAALACALTAFALSRLSRRQIGGHTGDTLGATQLACEIAILVAICA